MSLTVAEEMRETLISLNELDESLDRYINEFCVNVHQDLKRTLAVASLSGLRCLVTALRERRVIHRAYRGDSRVGCLVFHLFGVTNNNELIDLALPSIETGFTIYRTIQAWDHRRLSREVVEHFLEQELASRESHPATSWDDRKQRETP